MSRLVKAGSAKDFLKVFGNLGKLSPDADLIGLSEWFATVIEIMPHICSANNFIARGPSKYI